MRHCPKPPLNAILGRPRVMADEPGLAPNQRNLLDNIMEAGYRCSGA